jgi:hypothetical protein
MGYEGIGRTVAMGTGDGGDGGSNVRKRSVYIEFCTLN